MSNVVDTIEGIKKEILYILESRLSKYVGQAKLWFEKDASKIKGTYTSRLSGDIPLYFRSYARKWTSLIPNVSPFCFCFTKDLGVGKMIDSQLRIEDWLEKFSVEGLYMNGLKLVAKKDTHLLGTARQVIIMFPEEYEREEENKKVEIFFTYEEALALMTNETIPLSTRQKFSRALKHL